MKLFLLVLLPPRARPIQHIWAVYQVFMSMQISGRARGGGAVGGEQQRGEVGDSGEGDAATEAPHRRLRRAGVAVR